MNYYLPSLSQGKFQTLTNENRNSSYLNFLARETINLEKVLA